MKTKSFFTNFLLYLCLIFLLFIFLSCGNGGKTNQPSNSTQNDGTGQPPGNGNVPPPVPSISFANDIKPIFDANCNFDGCHGANPPSGLLLTSYENFQKGGRSGPAFIPKDSNNSLIIKRIEPGGGMPLGRPELPKEQVDKIKQWIDEGGENN
jgi:hypothetical protein